MNEGDQAFRATGILGREIEPTYSGALSFLRRGYTRDLDGVDVVVSERAGGTPVFVSFDIEGLDPAFASGTGTPVVGGLASWQAPEFIRGLEPLNLIGMEVVEVSPPFDHAEITALAAATVAHDWLCLLAKQRGAVEARVGRT